MSLPRTCVLAVTVAFAVSMGLQAQTAPSVVVDPAGLPLPGATIRVLHGTVVVASATTAADGSFVLDAAPAGDTVEVSLNGFETIRVPRAIGLRIMLPLAHTAETTTVVAPIGATNSPTSTAVGNTLTAATVARLPSAQMKAKESLPLLPSVIRGPDGLMHLGGATAHDTPVVLDGFNVTDPATGLSSLNLPYEMVRGVEVLRDPMAVTYGGLLAGVVTMESRPGGDARRIGVQGLVPRPRFSTPGFGRLEGIFPRVYVDGAAGDGRTRYATAMEFDYERIPVPGVTQGRGPDTVEQGTTVFARLDRKFRDKQSTTVEGFLFTSGSGSQGLSPRREDAATIDLRARDAFIGVVHRVVMDAANVLTFQFGALGHRTTVDPRGEGASILSPYGWSGNSSTTASRQSLRTSASVTWDRVKTVKGRAHDLTVTAEVSRRSLNGRVSETPVIVEDGDGAIVRRVTFAEPAVVRAGDTPMSAALRDVWHATPRLDVDAGVRMDHSRYGGAAPSSRAGLRYVLDASGATVLRLGYGGFVGSLPLAVPAFGSYPIRVDQFIDPSNGMATSEVELRPTIGALHLPRAVAATASVERHLRPGLDGQVSVTDRRSSRIARLDVPLESGPLTVSSTGTGHYSEFQVSARQSWSGNQELFVSYVLSSAYGELNDFAVLFHGLDAPLVQPGGTSRLAGDARHRVLAWGTVNLPSRIVISPVLEWRTGFRYSPVDERLLYMGAPNSRAFPTFLAADMVVYKTVTFHARTADVGVQLFNLTNHRNPREVYAVTDEPRFGTFTNSVGPVLRGYMLVKW